MVTCACTIPIDSAKAWTKQYYRYRGEPDGRLDDCECWHNDAGSSSVVALDSVDNCRPRPLAVQTRVYTFVSQMFVWYV